MYESDWIEEQSTISLKRLFPRLDTLFEESSLAGDERDLFERRLKRHWRRLFLILVQLYGSEYDFYYHLERLLLALAQSWIDRAPELRALDRDREAEPQWFLSESMVGGVLYVDLFSDQLSGLNEHIAYFQELGLTYLHLMPLFAVPRGENDGGYAVSDYRTVNPSLGTMDELSLLAGQLREAGISLVLDFVFNHTSDEHEWALKAKGGDRSYQNFYYLFPDRSVPDQYEHTLRDIFPAVRKGSFTWSEQINRWVWTTFNSYQWDLNYRNPSVFRAMAEEMLFLANQGVEVLRMDAVAFIWKEMGTVCENLPEAHLIVEAYNLMCRIAAPSLAFKSEAIVHPDEVIKYIGSNRCQLSYNPLFMALLWEALATRDVRLLEHAMRNRHRVPKGCSWVNYLRCHDDIGWTFDDRDALEVGINPKNHRKFLNEFYTGAFPGSFARGVPFQFNPENGDLRISGTLASLAGLEEGLNRNDTVLIDLALRRIYLLRSIIVASSGIPLFFLGGEEWGVLNDYGYITVSHRAGDSRWVHRPRMPWRNIKEWGSSEALEKRIYDHLVRLNSLRKRQPAFYDSNMDIIHTGNPHIYGFTRTHDDQHLLILANMSEHTPSMQANRVRLHGSSYRFRELLSNTEKSADSDLQFEPYQCMWLEPIHSNP